jgi:hypothetical protein
MKSHVGIMAHCASDETRALMADAYYFFFSHLDVGELEILDHPKPGIAVPFKTCYFQSIDGPFLKGGANGIKDIRGVQDTKGNAKGIFSYFHALLVNELSPGVLESWVLASKESPEVDEYALFKIDFRFDNAICHFTEQIASSMMGEVQISERFKYKENGEKKTKKIKRAIYVTPNKKKYIQEAEREHRSINWDYSWNVRGHWRRVKGFGHDREGNVCSEFTWVKPHQKGDGPLIKKHYLVRT